MSQQRIPALKLFLTVTLLIAALVGLPAYLAHAQNTCAITIGAVNDLTADCTLPGSITIPANAPATVINGNGYTIRSLTNQQPFTVSNNAVLTLQNLTLTGGSVSNGDAIFNIIGGGIVLENSVVSNHAASGSSVIFNIIGGNMDIKNSVVTGNNVSGGGIVFNLIGSTMTVRNSIVDGIASPADSPNFNTVGSTIDVTAAQAEPPTQPTATPEPEDVDTTAISAQPATCQITTDYRVNLRETPGNGILPGDVLVVIPYQTTLTALAEQSGWYEVTWQGQTGWLMAEYVTAECE